MKTKISVKEIMKLNKWIKTEAQAKKIIHDVNTKPSFSLNDVIKTSTRRG